jgi:hypothetical protein
MDLKTHDDESSGVDEALKPGDDGGWDEISFVQGFDREFEALQASYHFYYIKKADRVFFSRSLHQMNCMSRFGTTRDHCLLCNVSLLLVDPPFPNLNLNLLHRPKLQL